MIENIRILLKRPGESAVFVEPANDLKALQHLVGGYIETVTIADRVVVICNEEGRLQGLPYNVTIWDYDFVGTILIAGVKGDEFSDLPVSDGALRFMLPQLFREG